MAVNDKDYIQLQQSITKALIGLEMPLKVKHVRAAIIGSYRYQGSATLWSIIYRQPIMENRITAWKFCHLLHSILREGHNLCCQESVRNIKYLNDLGKLWSHLTDGYGVCILQYTKLLVLKIQFHTQNPQFPGTLKMARNEFEQIEGTDINIVFQLTMEIFDYLDAIIALQATVFNSLKTFKLNSMKLPGQCKVAALIPCLEDANQLYAFVIRFMYKLHVNLPHDMLDEHRQRFNAIFHKMRSFYKQCDGLQYFVNLVKVPKLPDQLPNFLVNNETNEYQTPQIAVPEKPIDSTPMITVSEENPKPQTIYFEELIRQRDNLIAHLQQECSTIRSTFEFNHKQYEQRFTKLNGELILLKNELHSKDNTLRQIQQEKQLIEENFAHQVNSLEQKNNELIAKIQELETTNNQLFETNQKLGFTPYPASKNPFC